jgi:hypothetical protein
MKTYLKISFTSAGKSLSITFIILLCCCTFISQQVLGQFADDFSDDDFTNNPTWTGSSSDFIINASDQLQLNSTAAGTSSLVVPFSFIALGTSEWQFNIQHQVFSGSVNNFSRIYLMSDQPNLTSALNGYYLQFGENGSNDAVELFRQTGLTSISVCRAATSGGIANPFNIRVKVNRSSTGAWEIRIDYSGGTNFILETSGIDNTHTSTSFFGLRCTYTVTNATRFFFDNFIVSAIPAPDLTPPAISSVSVLSQTEVEVLFTEPLSTNAETESNYSIAGETINPIIAEQLSDQKKVRLTFAQPFNNGVQQTLTVKNVFDLAGNSMLPVSVNFLFFQPVQSAYK